MSLLMISLLFSVLRAPGGRILAQTAGAQASAEATSARSIQTASEGSAQGQDPPQPVKPGKQTKKHERIQTLTGTVEWEYETLYWSCDVPNCDHFALYDDASHTNYEIDDARAALPFEGKKAIVTGIVDKKNHTIHLLSIQASQP